MQQIPTENSCCVTPSVANPSFGPDVPIEEWQSTRFNLKLMLSNEFNEYYEEVEEYLKENEDFDIEKHIGFIDDYPLSINYIETNVHDTPRHLQYLISSGGPGSEIRFFVGNNPTKPYKVEFYFMAWSTVTTHDVTGEDVVEHLWEQILFPLTEQIETRNEELSARTQEIDPLLAVAGTLKWEHIGSPDTTSPPEIRVAKGAHEDNPDPLLALAGTLQSDVTDISERHDDYIAAALLAELRGDEDE